MSATEVKAVLKFVRISPQKVRKLVEAVKGKLKLEYTILGHYCCVWVVLKQTAELFPC